MKRLSLFLLQLGLYTVLLGIALWFWHPSFAASAAALLFLNQDSHKTKWSSLSSLVFVLIAVRYGINFPVLAVFFGVVGILVSSQFLWSRYWKVIKVLQFLRATLWFVFALTVIIFVFPEYTQGSDFWWVGGLFVLSLLLLLVQIRLYGRTWKNGAQFSIIAANLAFMGLSLKFDMPFVSLGLFIAGVLCLLSLESFFLQRSVFGPFLFQFFEHRENPDEHWEQKGVDLRGVLAIELIRKGMEPSFYILLIFAWLSTSVHQVLLTEVGVRESFGIPEVESIPPGPHFSLPWPLGTIHRVPVHRVYSTPIGHDDEEAEEEDSILWADQHAEEEFVLLLGEGGNLLAADGLLSYQISDPHRYLYTVENPEQLLRHFAYRALMQETVHRELEATLSENALILARQVSQRIERELELANIGLSLLHFSFSALHPPVEVADAYQGVVSAQISQKSTLLNAQVASYQQLSRAQTQAFVRRNKEKGLAAKQLSMAAAEAATFQGLYQSVYSSLELYEFRLRQEALQRNLKGRELILIDHRFEEEGGVLWIEP